MSAGKTILVCGGRDWCDIRAMITEMDKILDMGPVAMLIHGGAQGADDEAECWAQWREIPVRQFKADWKTHGKAAGPIRNQQMIDEGKPDLVVAFPGGRGTADMVRRAKAANIHVIEIPVAEFSQ